MKLNPDEEDAPKELDGVAVVVLEGQPDCIGRALVIDADEGTIGTNGTGGGIGGGAAAKIVGADTVDDLWENELMKSSISMESVGLLDSVVVFPTGTDGG
jgi:hypothetical protein